MVLNVLRVKVSILDFVIYQMYHLISMVVRLQNVAEKDAK